jgi:hypothetical protein
MFCKIIKQFITEEQQQQMQQWFTTTKQKGQFWQFPDDPTRYNCKALSFTDLPQIIFEIKSKIMDTFNVREYEEPDPRKYVFFNYHLEGAQVHKHRHFPHDGVTEFRCNIIISKPLEGGMPVICDTTYIVEERDLWAFDAHDQHWTTPVKGNKPRMMMSFGFVFPTIQYNQRIASQFDKEENLSL